MTKPLLLTKQFIDLELLEQGYIFPDNLLDLLGKNLTAWIESKLEKLCSGNSPTIEGQVSDKAHIEGQVYIAKGATVEPFAYIKGPAYIGPNAQVRHGAYIRGSVWMEANSVVGHSTEVKGSVFFKEAKAAHFAYVGDSILGNHVNLGAGTKLANFILRKDEVAFLDPETGKKAKSGLRKFGAIIGDGAQTGCNSVLSPGSLLLPKTLIWPTKHYHGTLKEGSVR